MIFMHFFYCKSKSVAIARGIVFILCVLLSCPTAFSQVLPYMTAPNQLLTRTATFNLPYLVGMEFSSRNPFDFTFILNRGNISIDKWVARSEVEKVNRYFLAALAIPAKDLWVNLSPYEKSRISTDYLAMTDLGKDMLGEDYMLKQLSSSLTYPESDLGKNYWDLLYKRIFEALRTTKVKVNSFNKVWIVPGEVKIVESSRSMVVEKATLKVMLEKDYLASTHNHTQETRGNGADQEIDKISADVMRETILPQIEKEVNEGRHFAHLRQLYRAIIIANWFKKKLKDTIIEDAYFGKNKLGAAVSMNKGIREKIYNEYVTAFNKGVYNYVRKESGGRFLNNIVKRTYFSGGENLSGVDSVTVSTPATHAGVQAGYGQAGGDIEAAIVAEGSNGDGPVALGGPSAQAPGTTGGLDFANSKNASVRIEGEGIDFDYKDAIKFLSSPDFAGLLLRTVEIKF